MASQDYLGEASNLSYPEPCCDVESPKTKPGGQWRTTPEKDETCGHQLEKSTCHLHKDDKQHKNTTRAV